MVIQRRPHCSATVGGGAGTAGRVEHEVAGVGGHEDAALNDLLGCFNYVTLFEANPAMPRIAPDVVFWKSGEVIEVADIVQAVCP